MNVDLVPFDLTGPLPSGRLAIEASAGAGKTYALAALAARFVLEDGVAVGELLVVTFTRVAAAELRDRVRRRLSGAADALAAIVAGREPIGDDPLLVHLCSTDAVLRLERARAALADFDSATITTIHGFAQQMLGTLGTAAGGDLDATLADDGGELLRQVCSDVLVAEALDHPDAGDRLPTQNDLVRSARDVTANPGIRPVPGPDPDASNEPAALRRRLVDRVVAEIERRRRASGTLSFDDLLTRLRDALVGSGASGARDALRRRFRVAFIDEFQDTDPVQWEIFRSLFGETGSGTTLVLVGDPKQAIYGFRGANVHTYLDAIEMPGTVRAALGTNWRSDVSLLKGLGALLSGTTFGDSRISFQPVEAEPGNRGRRLETIDGDPLPGVSVRLALGADLPRNVKNPKEIKAAPARRAIFADLADAVRDLLERATVPNGETRRLVQPDDIAVLVFSHSESPEVRDALAAVGVPAVIARGESVLKAPAAVQWRWLLEAVAQPANPQRARTAALGWFIGWTADALVAADDVALAQVQEQLHHWSEILAARGVPDFFRSVWSESGVAARVLATADGDRSMTDLDHLAELLAATAARRTGPAGLLATLDQLTIEAATKDVEVDLAARRVESDADAVQIMTMHASKGLEFPIVCCPSLSKWRNVDSVIYQDPADGKRTIDVAPSADWPTKGEAQDRRKLADREAVGQSLRLLYVALTRARHQTLLWWTRAQSSDKTGLARVLFARDETGIDAQAFVGEKVVMPADDMAGAVLSSVVAAGGGNVELLVIGEPQGEPRSWTHPAPDSGPELSIATLDHALDRSRRRWSFTAITARAHEAVADPLDGTLGDAGAGDEGSIDDVSALVEHDRGRLVAEVSVPEPSGPIPLGALPGGTGFGTLVHRVLEHVDFAATDLEAALRAQVVDAVRWEGLAVDVDALTLGLVASVTTPLGPLLDGRSLSELAPRDRLVELDFELTLGEEGQRCDDADVGRLVLAHLSPDDPLRPWAEGLAAGRFGAVLAGHLVGSIDAVLRVDEPGSPQRFVVVDYKTNNLTERGTTPTVGDYHPERLPLAMAGHDYPLQALLYSVALHRYLRWRLPEYDPDVHLGGVAYLFVRGMVGPDTPLVEGVPHGVFSWSVPAGLIEELSDLLDGRTRVTSEATE